MAIPLKNMNLQNDFNICGKTMENYKLGPNVVYLALGITEGRPAGAFWADKIVFFYAPRARRPICTQRSFFAAQLTRGAIFSQRSFSSS